MILWLWGNLSGDFGHLGGLANVRNLVDEMKQKLSFVNIFFLNLVCVPTNKPTYKKEYCVVDEELISCQKH
jgi:hypothetical protein